MQKNYIAGEWTASEHSIDNLNPSDTRDIIGQFAQASRADLDRALDAAKSAQKYGPKAESNSVITH